MCCKVTTRQCSSSYARESQVCLRNVTTLPWPTRSPDVSPIEHIWDHLGWRVGHPMSLNELEASLYQISKEMSQDIIQNLLPQYSIVSHRAFALEDVQQEEKPEDLTRKDEMDWITKNSDAIAYIKLSLADEQALQFAAEDNAKVLWDKIRATYIGEGEDRKIDAGNELKNIRVKNGETVADYIARAWGISTKCHSLGLDVSPRELVYHTVRGLNGKFSKVRDILKTQRGKGMDEILQILREE
ncbi:retrovirus-related Pol polyprotein from transposon TNT 1-94 [Trichonephila clavipes]|nr:retrovirus-related Pol polyprotein from transposon TNT 1-94 [Trichonephila clavipes]